MKQNNQFWKHENICFRARLKYRVGGEGSVLPFSARVSMGVS